MKKLKQLLALMTAVAICVLLPGFNSLTVSAEEPVTYYVRYVDSEGEWRFQVGSSTWNENAGHRELYYMNQDIKDGDVVIVEGIVADKPLDIPVHLSNLTILHADTAVVTTRGIDECFVLKDCVAAINGDVKNAHVYDNARCTFNNNVDTLSINDDEGLHATVSVGGTVNHLTGNDPFNTYYDYYSFPAGTLSIEDGRVKTDEKLFSKTAPAADGTQTQGTAPAPEAPSAEAPDNTQTPAADSAQADEYDDVPKTGDNSLIPYLLGISILCFAASFCLRKHDKQQS